MDYKKNLNVFSFWKVRHVELRLKVGVCGSEDRAEMMPSLYMQIGNSKLCEANKCIVIYSAVNHPWWMSMLFH